MLKYIKTCKFTDRQKLLFIELLLAWLCKHKVSDKFYFTNFLEKLCSHYEKLYGGSLNNKNYHMIQ